MKTTYNEALTKVFKDEGGYSNDAGDPGGPTNWGITIADARMYWKKGATAADVKAMPKSAASDIYDRHYATPIRYNDLPAGVDYAVLDYGINSGINRAVKVLQRIVGVKADGKMGDATIASTLTKNPVVIINAIYDERLAFLKGLKTWSTFGKGWNRRCVEGRALALNLYNEHKSDPVPHVTPTHVIVGTAAAGTIAATSAAYPHLWPYAAATAAVGLVGTGIYYYYKNKGTKVVNPTKTVVG